MTVLRIWGLIAGTVLAVSVVAHLSTFTGIDPMDVFPGVMLIHILIFPPFVAAMLYVSRISGNKSDTFGLVIRRSPRWLHVIVGGLIVYAVLNFVLFMFLNEGGTPNQKDGKYVLLNHGQLIRELTEMEYHRQRAYIVRGFSGHWMVFSAAALMGLVAADPACQQPVEGEGQEPSVDDSRSPNHDHGHDRVGP